MPKTGRRRRGIPRPKSRQQPDAPQSDLSAGPLEPLPEIDAAVKATRERLYGPLVQASNRNGNGNGGTRIVSPNPAGGWDIRAPNASRVSAHKPTQAAADKRAAEILRNQGGGERITQGRDGRIRSKDTIAPGRDPAPPHDKEH